jgi:hypothetical protein
MDSYELDGSGCVVSDVTDRYELGGSVSVLSDLSDIYELDGSGFVMSHLLDRYEVNCTVSVVLVRSEKCERDGIVCLVSDLWIDMNWTEVVQVALNLRFVQNTLLLKIRASWRVTK